MIRLIFLVLAIVLFLLIAFGVLDTNIVKWEAGAFASFAASFAPWPDGRWSNRPPA
jgi:hypothetical protein